MDELIPGLFGIVLMALLLGSLIKPWLHGRRLQEIDERLAALSQKLDRLSGQQVYTATPEPVVTPEPAPVAAPIYKSVPEVLYVEEPVIAAPLVSETSASRRDSFERNFGAKLPVWIGGIALAFAGFYLVRYSIEMGLLGPGMRTILGLLFGGVLIAAAHRIGPHQAKIGQSLAGAGIAVLYCALFAATSLFQLIPPLVGFAGMAATTALAVIMAVRHGAPIAVLGMLGGFLTPMLVGSNDGNTPLLLTYIYVLFTALFWFIRRQQWWGLLLLLMPLGLLWALAVFFFMAPVGDLIFVSLFLMALCITVIKGTRDMSADIMVAGMSGANLNKYVNYAVLTCAAVLTGMATAQSGYDLTSRLLMLLLTAGTIGLAWFDRPLYGFAPWLALIVNAAILLAWINPDGDTLMLSLLLLSLLYGGLGSWLVWRSTAPLFWSLLSSSALAIFFLIGHALNWWTYPRIAIWPYISFPFWGSVAFLLADLMVNQARRVRRTVTDDALAQKLLAVFATAASGFIALGLTVELPYEYLSVAIAAELLALAYINTKVQIVALRKLVALAGVGFAVLLLPQLALMFQLGAYSLAEARIYIQGSLPIMHWPLFQLGLPAVLFIAATLYLRRQKDDRLVKCFEWASIALLGLMGYYLMRHIMHPDDDVLFIKAGFIERGTFTNILLVFAVTCGFISQRFARPAVLQAALVLAGIALFRLGWFDLLIYNPAFALSQNVGRLPLLNGVTLTYALPILWLSLLKGPSRFMQLTRVAQMLLAFAFVTFTIRHGFHGEILAEGRAENAEMYTYSIAWLLFGLGLLVQGTRTADRAMRLASLALVILTVGKVFLVDADELTGLWRVFSFLGLGLSLMGISWFYNRFIFKRDA